MNKLPVYLCSYLWSNASALCSMDEKCWEMLFFCDFRMVFLYLINHLKLRFFSIYFCRSVLTYFFAPSKTADNWKYCKNILSVSDWTLFPCLGFNVSHVAFSDYKSGFGGKFGVQTERQDPSAVGFDYKEKLAKHESQQGTVFTCYFLTSAATSHTVWNSSLSRSMPGMCRHFIALLFFHDPAVFFILPLKSYLKQACVQETPSV